MRTGKIKLQVVARSIDLKHDTMEIATDIIKRVKMEALWQTQTV